MAKTVLVDRAVEAGDKLVRLLDQSDFPAESALWLYRPESSDWILLLALPTFKRVGPRRAYVFIQDLLARTRELDPLSIDDVEVTSTDDPLIRLLRPAIRTGRSVNRIRFTRSRVGNAFIEDALIYRLQ